MGLVEDVWGLDESFWGLLRAVWRPMGASGGCSPSFAFISFHMASI